MTGCIALVVGAGRGRRFGGDLPKQYSLLAGTAVIARTLSAFAAHPGIAAVRAVIHADDRDLYDAAVSGLPADKFLPPVAGGASRQESARLGLESLRELSPGRVLIHDAARPFVSAALIDRVLAGLDAGPGVIAALPVHDTLKNSRDGQVDGTVDRTGLWRAQTPQGFDYRRILQAHDACRGAELTDDAAVAERAGISVGLVVGGEDNVKITTRDDMMTAENKLGQWETRTGQGFDVHRFRPGDGVTLGGVQIPHSQSLEGHSDADVALHALTDALLGAIGADDIGGHFPPGEADWKDAPSTLFLARARDLIRAAGGRVVNVDVTVICEAPRIGPYRQAMRDTIAATLQIDAGRVSVKATTTERLGFTGRGEGIAAQAVANVRTTMGGD